MRSFLSGGGSGSPRRKLLTALALRVCLRSQTARPFSFAVYTPLFRFAKAIRSSLEHSHRQLFELPTLRIQNSHYCSFLFCPRYRLERSLEDASITPFDACKSSHDPTTRGKMPDGISLLTLGVRGAKCWSGSALRAEFSPDR